MYKLNELIQFKNSIKLVQKVWILRYSTSTVSANKKLMFCFYNRFYVYTIRFIIVLYSMHVCTSIVFTLTQTVNW